MIHKPACLLFMSRPLLGMDVTVVTLLLHCVVITERKNKKMNELMMKNKESMTDVKTTIIFHCMDFLPTVIVF